MSAEQIIDRVAAVSGLLTLAGSILWYRWYSGRITFFLAQGEITLERAAKMKRRLPLAFVAAGLGYALWVVGKSRQQ